MYGYTEDALVEQPAIELFRDTLGWESADLFRETFGEDGTEGRRSEREVVLVKRLRVALRRLNPDVPEAGLEQAVEQLTEERGLMSAVAANREVYELLKEGRDGHGERGRRGAARAGAFCGLGRAGE